MTVPELHEIERRLNADSFNDQWHGMVDDALNLRPSDVRALLEEVRKLRDQIAADVTAATLKRL